MPAEQPIKTKEQESTQPKKDEAKSQPLGGYGGKLNINGRYRSGHFFIQK